VRAEHALEELGGDLVVLRVRGVGLDRDITRPQLGDKRRLIGAALLAQAKRAHGADTGAQDGLGHKARIDDALDQRRAV
jgi:hypothetical protein